MDEPKEPRGTVDDPEARRGHAEDRLVRGDPDVAGDRHLQPPAVGEAVQHGDDRRGERFQGADHVVERVVRQEHLLLAGSPRRDRPDVVPRAERLPPFPAQHHAPGLLPGKVRERLPKFPQDLQVERVLLRRVGENDGRHRPLPFDDDLSPHRFPPVCPWSRAIVPL